MPLHLRHDDPRLSWPGAISLERTPDWTMPWRIPHDRLDLFPTDALHLAAGMAAGVRLAFRSDTTTLSGAFTSDPTAKRLDLCLDDRFSGSCDIEGKGEFRFDGLPAGDKGIELWLPPHGKFRLHRLTLSDGATVAPLADGRPRWITYGSSITHCVDAESPTQTWPAIVARERGLHLTCLGFGGQCHLDTMIARLMRDLPADVLSMCVGINIFGHGSLNIRTFRANIIGFTHVVREKHPDTPFAIISPIAAPPRENTPNKVDFTLDAMRAEVAAAVTAMQAHGDHNLHYVNGLDLFGPEFGALLYDGVHPNAEGYKQLGRRFLERVMAKIYPAQS